MATNNSSTSRSIPQGFLSRIPVGELKLIRVAVKRNNITTSLPAGPIDRSIDDPKLLIPFVHLRKDGIRRPKRIFDRDDIVVNQEERFASSEPERTTTQKTHSVTYSRSLSSTSGRRSRTRSHSRTPTRDKRKSFDKNNPRDKDVDREKKGVNSPRSVAKERGGPRDRERERSLERDRDSRAYKSSRPYSREREEDRYRRRSRTPLRPGEYRPSHSELRHRSSSKERDHARDKYRTHSRRSRSPSVDYHKPSTSRKPSRSPRRSVTPPRDWERPKSPRYEQPKSRRSRSPSKVGKHHYSDKRGREPSPSYKHPDKRRTSGSPRHERDRKRSRSPRYREGSRSRSSPGRHEGYSSRNRSRSPRRHESYKGSPDKPCRSPHPPIVTFDRSRRRSSRSPGYERDRGYYKHRRSRSRSPRKRRSRSPLGREAEFAFYEGIPGPEYWIPRPMRPGLPTIPGYYPPAFFPRMPGAPIIIPPRIPMAPYPIPYRQRLPVYNSKQRPKVANPGTTGNEGTVSTTARDEAEAGPSTSQASGEVTIQEVTDSECHQSAGSDGKSPGGEVRDSLHEKD